MSWTGVDNALPLRLRVMMTLVGREVSTVATALGARNWITDISRRANEADPSVWCGLAVCGRSASQHDELRPIGNSYRTPFMIEIFMHKCTKNTDCGSVPDH
jgi:hypothetical protein